MNYYKRKTLILFELCIHFWLIDLSLRCLEISSFMYVYIKMFQALCEELTKKAATLVLENESLKKVWYYPLFYIFLLRHF